MINHVKTCTVIPYDISEKNHSESIKPLALGFYACFITQSFFYNVFHAALMVRIIFWAMSST